MWDAVMLLDIGTIRRLFVCTVSAYPSLVDGSDTWLYKFIIAFGRQLGTMYRVACFDMPSQN